LLSRKAKFGILGVLFSGLALMFGGHTIEVEDFNQGIVSISLDWLLLDILILSLIFIPLELFLPKHREQTRFHSEWKTDLIYFSISHLFVQLTAVAIKTPAETLLSGEWLIAIRDLVLALPFIAQLFLAMFFADLFQYFIHRLFHKVKYLWRFHAVHHSIRSIDWIAGSRLHIVDILITRSFSYLPIYILGVSMPVFYAYVVVVSLQAVGAHANIRVPFGFLKYLFVTPQYHHWHHCEDPNLYDKNFAIHFPFIDKIFGTYYLPGRYWPESTGLGNVEYPKGYFRQLFYPFLKDPSTNKLSDPSKR
ncbi:MAG TPA: sterol desaturase, partial [Planctomycetes bacterium]|nr:sterol desaturase [Planctomycetota bacterium]